MVVDHVRADESGMLLSRAICMRARNNNARVQIRLSINKKDFAIDLNARARAIAIAITRFINAAFPR